MKLLRIVVVLLAVMALAQAAWAQGNSTAPEPEYVEPEPALANATAGPEASDPPDPAGLKVWVEQAGNDELGLRLGLALKEAVAVSPLFAPAGAGQRCLKVVVRTEPLFADRPTVGSMYSVAWLYVEGPDVLAYYLDGCMGQVSPGGERAKALAILSLTDKVAARFGYLFSQGEGSGVNR